MNKKCWKAITFQLYEPEDKGSLNSRSKTPKYRIHAINDFWERFPLQ